MKVLLLHNSYQQRSGEEKVVRSEKELLEAHGHQVFLLEVDNSQISSFLEKAKAFSQSVYSYRSKKLVEGVIKSFFPDIVHVHNFFPLLSPSIYYVCRNYHIPVVQTLHNYRILCANAVFYRSNAVCEDCLGKLLPIPAILNRCYRSSFIGSFALASMQGVHKYAGTWSNQVDIYIALSQFAKDKFIQGGLPEERIFVKPNFLISDPGFHPKKSDSDACYALYVGRLDEAKGIKTLLAAWQTNKISLPLKIIGSGPLEEEVRQASHDCDEISFLGYKKQQEVYDLISDATCLLLPSEWYESFPIVVLEAFASGTPIIATKIGSLSELIRDGQTGLHFHVADPDDLAQKVEWMFQNQKENMEMSLKARNHFESHFTAKQNYMILMRIYRNAIDTFQDRNIGSL